MSRLGIDALEYAAGKGWLLRRELLDTVQYTAGRPPRKAEMDDFVAAVYRASRWVGAHGLTVSRGRKDDDVVFIRHPREEGP